MHFEQPPLTANPQNFQLRHENHWILRRNQSFLDHDTPLPPLFPLPNLCLLLLLFVFQLFVLTLQTPESRTLTLVLTEETFK